MVSGHIKDKNFIQFLENAMNNYAQGHIVFTLNQNEKTIFFRKKHITSVKSNDPSDYLGQYLISHGYISLDQFNEAYQTQLETGIKMGQVLNITGLVENKTLQDAIFEKIIDTVFMVFCWDECTYEIHESYPSYIEQVPVKVSLNSISIHLAERANQFDQIIDMFSKLGAFPQLHIIDKDISHLERIELQILEFLMVGKNMRETINAIPTHNYMTFRATYQLYTSGYISPGHGSSLGEIEIDLMLEAKSSYSVPVELEQPEDVEETEIYQRAQMEMEKNNYLVAASYFHMLYAINPDNIIFLEYYHKAQSKYVLHFYKNIFSPFSVLELHDSTTEIDEQEQLDIIASIKEDEHISVRNIVDRFKSQGVVEVIVLSHLETLQKAGYISKKEPENLIEAIEFGHPVDIDKFAQNKKVLEDRYDFQLFKNITPLMIASIIGNYNIVEYLVVNSVAVDATDDMNKTALMYAISHGNDDIAIHLIDNGADINAKNKNDYTVLMLAVSKGMYQIVDYLIKHDVDVNAVNAAGQTALNSALRFNYIDIVLRLICAGADTTIKDEEGMTAISYAESNEARELIELGYEKCLLLAEKKREDADDKKQKRSEKRNQLEALSKAASSQKKNIQISLVILVIFTIVGLIIWNIL